jgi:hypothetical protein
MDMQSNEIKVEIDEATSGGIYCNAAFITHSETEFILDFAFLQPQTPKAKVASRIVTSPTHAKRLLWALKDNLDRYEARFGPIATHTAAESGGQQPARYQ